MNDAVNTDAIFLWKIKYQPPAEAGNRPRTKASLPKVPNPAQIWKLFELVQCVLDSIYEP